MVFYNDLCLQPLLSDTRGLLTYACLGHVKTLDLDTKPWALRPPFYTTMLDDGPGNTCSCQILKEENLLLVRSKSQVLFVRSIFFLFSFFFYFMGPAKPLQRTIFNDLWLIRWSKATILYINQTIFKYIWWCQKLLSLRSGVILSNSIDWNEIWSVL